MLFRSRLHGRPHHTNTEIVAFAEERVGLPAGIVKAVIDLTHHPEHGDALVARLGEYLRATEQLWSFVDAWRS